MALRTPPLWEQNGSHPANNDRLGVQGLYTATGVLTTSSLAVTANSPTGMSVLVASGYAAIIGTSTTNMGAYVAFNDATETLTITTADVTNPRIDRVVVTIRDSAYSGSSDDVIFQVIAGTPAASPSAPATPANSISLATIAVAANATQITAANITNTRTLVTTPITLTQVFSGCFTYQNTGAQTLTTGSDNNITFDTEDFDTDGFHSTSTNTTRITVPSGKAGKYLILGQVNLTNTNATGIRRLVLLKNGSPDVVTYATPNASSNVTLPVAHIFNMNVGDYVELRVTQESGGTVSVVQGRSSFFAVQYLGA